MSPLGQGWAAAHLPAVPAGGLHALLPTPGCDAGSLVCQPASTRTAASSPPAPRAAGPVCRKPISDEGSPRPDNGDGGPSGLRGQQARLADDWLATDLAFRLGVLQT